MTIFSRYVFWQTTSALLLVLLSLTGIVWISLALRELNVVTGQGQSALTLLQMTTLGLPSFVAVITPFALLITAIHTLNRLNSDSEIIVLTASGATAWTLAKPLILLALIITAFLTYVNHVAAPWSHRLLRDIVVQVRTDLLSQVIQPGRFSSPEGGMTFHIRERTLDGTLLGLILHDARKPDEVQSYLADKGVIVEDGDGTYLFMMDGHILRRPGGIGEPSQIIVFDKYAVDLASLEQRTARDAPTSYKARERYSHELLAPDRRAMQNKVLMGQWRAELHERISGTLYPLAFVLLAIALVGQAQSTRQNRHAAMAMCFLVGVGLRLGGLATNNIVAVHEAAVPAMYLIPLGTIAVAAILIVRGTSSARTSDFLVKIGDGVAAHVARLRSRLPRWRVAAAGREG